MLRHYCNYCGKRRNEKFMTKSPVDNGIYCSRYIKESIRNSCYKIYIQNKIKELFYFENLIIIEIEKNNYSDIKKFTEEKMSTRADIFKSSTGSLLKVSNQIDLIDSINSIESMKY